MTAILTKEDIEFDSAFLYSVIDPFTGNLIIKANVGYTIITVEGETIKRRLTDYEVTGSARTKVINLFSQLKTVIMTQEGI